MSLRRALASSWAAAPSESNARQAAFEAKPWSRRGWSREQLRVEWPHLTLQQVELLKEVFQHLFDTEDKGYFTRDELFFIMESMGRTTTQELDLVLVELDSNGDAVVDFPEFLTKFLKATDEQELLSVFHQLAIQEGDGGDDRVVTLTAIERSFQFVGEPLSDDDKRHLAEIFRRADRDGNGRLDIKEFTAHLERMDDELFMGLGQQASALGPLLAAAAAQAANGPSGGRTRSGRPGEGGGGRTCSGRPGDSDGRASPAGPGDAAEGFGGGGGGGMSWSILRALSGRNGGGGGVSGNVDPDVESLTSNPGGLRHSFLSRLGLGRQRRSSINAANLAALTEKLAALGYDPTGCAMRVGSVCAVAPRTASVIVGGGGGMGGGVSSGVMRTASVVVGGAGRGAMPRASSLQLQVRRMPADGPHSVRLPVYSHGGEDAGGSGSGGGGAGGGVEHTSAYSAQLPRSVSHFGHVPAPPLGTSPLAGAPLGSRQPAGGRDLVVEGSAVSVTRLASSMGRPGGPLSPDLAGGSGGGAAGGAGGGVTRGPMATAPVALSRAGSLQGVDVVRGSPPGWAARAAAAAAAAAAATGACGGVPESPGPFRVGSSGQVLPGGVTSADEGGGSAGGGNGGGGASSSREQVTLLGPPYQPSPQYQHTFPYSGQHHSQPLPQHLLPGPQPHATHSNSHLHALNPNLHPQHQHNPHSGYPAPPSRSPRVSANPPPHYNTPAGSPLALPSSNSARELQPPPLPSPDDDAAVSSFPSASISPTSPAGALGILGAPSAPGGSGMPPLDRAAVNLSYAARASAGLRPPAPTWRQPNVIQEAPEEGDASYGWVGMTPNASQAVVAPPSHPHPHPPMMTTCMSSRVPEHRTSAPTRFSRLRSFPDPQPMVGPNLGSTVPYYRSGGGRGAVAGSVSGDGVAVSVASASGGPGSLPGMRPLRTGSGGEGRRGPWLGGLMASMFSRQRSLGQAAGVGPVAASALRPRSGDAPGARSGSGSGASAGGHPEGERTRPTASQTQLLLPSLPSSPKWGTDGLISGSVTEDGAEGGEPPAKAAAGASWSFASAWAAMNWLRRGGSVGSPGSAASSSRGGGGGNHSGSLGGAAAAAPANATASHTSAPIKAPGGEPVAGSTRSVSPGLRGAIRIEVPGLTEEGRTRSSPIPIRQVVTAMATIAPPPSPATSPGTAASPFHAGASSAADSPAAALLRAGGSVGSRGKATAAVAAAAAAPAAATTTLAAASAGAGPLLPDDGRISRSSLSPSPSPFPSPLQLPQAGGQLSPTSSFSTNRAARLAALLPFYRGFRSQRTLSTTSSSAWPGAYPLPVLQPPEPVAAAGVTAPVAVGARVSSPSGMWASPFRTGDSAFNRGGSGSSLSGPLQPEGPGLGMGMGYPPHRLSAGAVGPGGAAVLRRSGSMNGTSSRLSVSSSQRDSTSALPSHLQGQGQVMQPPPHRLSQQGSLQVPPPYPQYPRLAVAGSIPVRRAPSRATSQLSRQQHDTLYRQEQQQQQRQQQQPWQSPAPLQRLRPQSQRNLQPSQPSWTMTSSPQLSSSGPEPGQAALALTEVASGSWTSRLGGSSGPGSPPTAQSAAVRTLERPMVHAVPPGRMAYGPGISGGVQQVSLSSGLGAEDLGDAGDDEPLVRRVVHRWYSHNPRGNAQLAEREIPQRQQQQEQPRFLPQQLGGEQCQEPPRPVRISSSNLPYGPAPGPAHLLRQRGWLPEDNSTNTPADATAVPNHRTTAASALSPAGTAPALTRSHSGRWTSRWRLTGGAAAARQDRSAEAAASTEAGSFLSDGEGS